MSKTAAVSTDGSGRCHICGKGPFKNEHGLKTHIARAHSPKKAAVVKSPVSPVRGGSFDEAILALTIKRDEHFQAMTSAIEVLVQLQKG